MNDEKLIETLKKFDQTPGLCTREEIYAADRFYTEYDRQHKLVKAVHNRDLVGFSVEAILEQVAWYKDNIYTRKV